MKPELPFSERVKLAEQLVRVDTRERARRILSEREPAVPARLRSAWEDGNSRFPVTEHAYHDSCWHLLGRLWKSALNRDGLAEVSDSLIGLDRGSFLSDLCAWVGGIEAPAAAAESFYAAFPGYRAQVDVWFDAASRRRPLGDVDRQRFRRKCHGVALYHLMGPLRVAVTQAPDVRRGFEDDPRRVVRVLEEKNLLDDLFFSVALACGTEPALQLFDERYALQIRRFLRKQRVAREELKDCFNDLRTEATLTACNYFASGSFGGWLQFECLTFLRNLRGKEMGSQSGLEHLPEKPPDAEVDVDQVQGLVRRALDSLEPAEIELVRELTGKTLRKVGEKLGVDETTVMRRRNVVYRKLKVALTRELRECLGQQASEEDCARFLERNALYVDFGLPETAAPPSEAASATDGCEPEAPEPEDEEYCPMVPNRLP